MRTLAFFRTSTASGVHGIFEPSQQVNSQLFIFLIKNNKQIIKATTHHMELLPSTSIRQPELTKLMASD